jgi:RNA polymerase sigma-70 factor (ECF subfamily)
MIIYRRMQHQENRGGAMDLQELLRGCEKSDRTAQAALFNLSKDGILHVCLRYSKNEEQARQIFKETYLSIFSSISSKSQDQEFDDWLKTQVINTAVQVLQRNKQEYKIVSTANAQNPGLHPDTIPDTEIMQNMDSSDVLKAIQALSPAYRVVVNLHLIDNHSFRKISEKLDVAEVTIQMNFEKAMYQLRKNLVQLTTASRAE